MNNTNIQAIGVGAYFPIELTESDDGKVTWKALSGDIRLINQNLITIFNTQIGMIIRNEDFGTRLWECLEEPNTQALSFLIRRFCKDAIESWEPRIAFVDSQVNREQTKINIQLTYRLLTEQSVRDLNFSYNPTNNEFTI